MAALLVVLSHIGLPDHAPQVAHQVVESGYVGVPLFFMLSGFVLAYSHPDLNGLRAGRATVRFYVARIVRVMPLYWAVLIVLALQRAAEARGQSHLWQMLLGIQTWSADVRVGNQDYNGPAWSINVELFLYLLFPLLMPAVAYIARRWGTRGLMAVLVASFGVQLLLCLIWSVKGWADLPAADPMSGHRWLYRNPLTRIPDFAMGLSLALLFARGVRPTTSRATLVQVGSVLAAAGITALRPWDGAWSGTWRVLSFGALYAVPFSLLLMSLATGTGLLARILSRPLWVTLGTASYALYITHRPIVEYMGADEIQASGTTWGYFAIPGLVGLCLLIAEGGHRYVEQPCRRFGLMLLNRWLPAATARPHPGRTTDERCADTAHAVTRR
ncbi:hypothetical protein VV02_18415 [Luteipulveratus mongoliensis]|uniref:Acyltransferase 3 domain-containing protein n=1 Tax=Luteipulveratus mongoliensis TaxID=571913 RepID=A0A0K1JKV7_9MICO|nr:hypothetical protein VV02_18415 [Luteipulveratus mongoliensis]